MMKRAESVLQPDPRFAQMVGFNEETGSNRPFHIDDLYALVQPLELGPAVPEEIRLQFDSARNAFLYSWFAYDLVTLAERRSYAVLEMALRFRAEQENPTKSTRKLDLKALLALAAKRGWLRREDFEVPLPGVPGKTICFLDVATKLRNNLAHGKMHLFPHGSLAMMRLCAGIISKLFPTA
jgi:hypothetical protein